MTSTISESKKTARSPSSAKKITRNSVPERCVAKWAEFRQLLSDPGPDNVFNSADLLHEIVFGRGVEFALKKYGANDVNSSAFKNIRRTLEYACMKLSELTVDANNGFRPLRDAINDGLMREFIKLKEKYYIDYTKPVTQEDHARWHEQKAEFNQHAEVQIVVSGLRATSNHIIRSYVHEAKRPFLDFIKRDLRQSGKIEDTAETLFQRSLYNYKLGKNSSFSTFVTRNLKDYLQSEVIHSVTGHAQSFHRRLGKSLDCIDTTVFSDHGLQQPCTKLIMSEDEAAAIRSKSDELKKLKDLLGGLPEKQRKILTRFYGLDGNTPESIDSISKTYKVSRQTIYNYIHKAVVKMRDVAAKSESATTDHDGGNTIWATKPTISDKNSSQYILR